jgi:hypothetical protein
MARSSAQKSTAHKRRISSDHIAGAKRAKQLDESSDELSEDEVSEFEDDELTTPSADEDEDSDDFDDRKTPRSRRVSKSNGKKNEPGSGSRKKGTPRNQLSAKDLSKPGVKTGLGPGTQVVIKKPKARDPGDTLYSDETIHPNTMLFLEDLAANNNRQWLKSELSSSYSTFIRLCCKNLPFEMIYCQSADVHSSVGAERPTCTVASASIGARL